MKGNVKTQENETYYQNKIDVSNSERNKGITLVALVVTIVVLLILAGITINYIMGDNSIFKKASDAKIEYQIAQAREKLEITFGHAKILKHTEKEYNQNN